MVFFKKTTKFNGVSKRGRSKSTNTSREKSKHYLKDDKKIQKDEEIPSDEDEGSVKSSLNDDEEYDNDIGQDSKKFDDSEEVLYLFLILIDVKQTVFSYDNN